MLKFKITKQKRNIYDSPVGLYFRFANTIYKVIRVSSENKCFFAYVDPLGDLRDTNQDTGMQKSYFINGVEKGTYKIVSEEEAPMELRKFSLF